MRKNGGEETFSETKTFELWMKRSGFSPWGFRLHGGADYGTPLVVLKVIKYS